MVAASLARVRSATDRWFSRLRDPFVLGVRLYWGWNFFLAGKGKLTNLGPTAETFAGWGVPVPAASAVLAGTAEAVCGLALLVGLFSRLATVPLIIVMTVAYLTAHVNEVASLADFVKAPPFTYLMACLIVLIFGPGAFSMDEFLSRWRPERSPKPGSE
jgi:putative oxidoreductase